MARITPLNTESPAKTVETIFQQIEGTFGRVPNLFKTYAHHPPKAVMMEGSLSRKVKETIAVLVSKDNSCSYCVAAHTGALRAIGVTDEELKSIEEDLDQAELRGAQLSPA